MDRIGIEILGKIGYENIITNKLINNALIIRCSFLCFAKTILNFKFKITLITYINNIHSLYTTCNAKRFQNCLYVQSLIVRTNF